ncbi:MAG: hypothetical protein R2713_08100 [Ilumatobacteraceae bacterium]
MDLFHFSHDPTIERFVPHVPVTNPNQPPMVWAIDAEHAPLYWFPRDCPRVTASAAEPGRGGRVPTGVQHDRRTGPRDRALLAADHAVDGALPVPLRRIGFRRWADASGQWVADVAVEPLGVERFDDLIGRHVSADIELRAVPDLWPLRDLAVRGPWDFSIVRFQSAKARSC